MKRAMTVNLHLSGEGIEFKREISGSEALRIMELSMSNGDTADEVQVEQENEEAEEQTEAEDDRSSLPNNFFSRLSSKQEALIHVLSDAEEPISSTELQRRMKEEHDETVGGGRGVAGLLQGFTKKHGGDFDLVKINWDGNEGYYLLNPERPEYIKEIKEYFKD